MSPWISFAIWTGVVFFAGWSTGDIRGYWKGWNRGMDIANRYRALLHQVTGIDELEPAKDEYKDLPS